MHIYLRAGLTANIAGYAFGTSAISGFVGLIGAAVANKALLMTGIAIFGPAFGAAALLGLAGLAISGPVYRWEMRKTTDELNAALAAIDTSLRAFDIFGDAPRVPQLRAPISSGRSTTDDPGFSPR